MTFLLIMTTWAMILNLQRYAGESQTMLLIVGSAIFVLEIWLLFEAVAGIRRVRAMRKAGEGAGATPRLEESGVDG